MHLNKPSARHAQHQAPGCATSSLDSRVRDVQTIPSASATRSPHAYVIGALEKAIRHTRYHSDWRIVRLVVP